MSAPDLDALQDAINRHKSADVDRGPLAFAENSYALIDELYAEVRRLREAVPNVLSTLVLRANRRHTDTPDRRAGEAHAYLVALDLIAGAGGSDA